MMHTRAILTAIFLLSTQARSGDWIKASDLPDEVVPVKKDITQDPAYKEAKFIQIITEWETSGSKSDALEALKYRRAFQANDPARYEYLQKHGLGRSPITGE